MRAMCCDHFVCWLAHATPVLTAVECQPSGMFHTHSTALRLSICLSLVFCYATLQHNLANSLGARFKCACVQQQCNRARRYRSIFNTSGTLEAGSNKKRQPAEELLNRAA